VVESGISLLPTGFTGVSGRNGSGKGRETDGIINIYERKGGLFAQRFP